MTTPKRAKLKHIKWNDNQKSHTDGDASRTVEVQFNPATLKVSFTNKNAGGDQPGGSSKQFVGSGETKLSVELLFDTTHDGTDVRRNTERVAFYVKADPDSGSGGDSNRVPPGIQFEWGSFIFRGVVDSMEETLDYFSEEGVPLRANIALSISRQEIEFLPGDAGKGGGGGKPLTAAPAGSNLQGLAGNDWKGVAAANGIDDPLRLQAGALIDLNAGVSASGGAGVSGGVTGGAAASGSALAKASAGAGVSAREAASASVGAGVTGGAGVRLGR